MTDEEKSRAVMSSVFKLALVHALITSGQQTLATLHQPHTQFALDNTINLLLPPAEVFK